MQAAFGIIISVIGALYALFTKQGKIAGGLLVMAIGFFFAIPNLVSGIWVDVFGALSMIFFAVGVFIVVFKKKMKEVKSEENEEPEKK